MQSGVETSARRVRSTCRSVRGSLHSEESSQTGEETAGKESEPNDTVLEIEIRHHSKNDSEDDEHDRHYFVLLFQIRHRTLADMRSDLLHQVGSLILAQHGAIEIIGKTEC